MLTIKKSKSYFILLAIMAFVVYLELYLGADEMSKEFIFFEKISLCWVGIFVLCFIIVSWKLITGKMLNLYTLFMTFFFMFNFGQCFLWAFGVHTEGEIGDVNLYGSVGVPTDYAIVKTQLLVLISGIMIHTGAILGHKKIAVSDVHEDRLIQAGVDKKNLYHFSMLLCPFAVASEYYYQVRNYMNAKVYGYTGLYYNTEVQSVNVVFQILARLFFPCVIGMLIGTNYRNKRIRIFSYTLFGIDVILSCMVGDRGGWLYALFILVICSGIFYKKIRFKDMAALGAIAYVGMIVLIAVKNIRNIGVTMDRFSDALGDAMLSPVAETLTEMGGTMGVTTVFVMKGWDIFPYGNTFLYGLLISPTKRIISLLHLNYESVSGWLSQSYLKISNGAGFSIVAEVLINFGPYLLPLAMVIVGVVIQKITDIDSCNKEVDVIPVFYKIITTSVIVNISRNAFSYNMGEVLYTTILFGVLFTIYKNFFARRR